MRKSVKDNSSVLTCTLRRGHEFTREKGLGNWYCSQRRCLARVRDPGNVLWGLPTNNGLAETSWNYFLLLPVIVCSHPIWSCVCGHCVRILKFRNHSGKDNGTRDLAPTANVYTLLPSSPCTMGVAHQWGVINQSGVTSQGVTHQWGRWQGSEVKSFHLSPNYERAIFYCTWKFTIRGSQRKCQPTVNLWNHGIHSCVAKRKQQKRKQR